MLSFCQKVEFFNYLDYFLNDDMVSGQICRVPQEEISVIFHYKSICYEQHRFHKRGLFSLHYPQFIRYKSEPMHSDRKGSQNRKSQSFYFKHFWLSYHLAKVGNFNPSMWWSFYLCSNVSHFLVVVKIHASVIHQKID